ncbi:lysR family transcriptional regulator [Acetobacter aceti NRIC 0242]|uniref:LysR family transcriptional regulator n=2 Tax=Acetobacter aceti TaxID=435 RepID=A0A6S6PK08_ACEAC|nr:hydrogen peroxide-inducible genes activator [Acetobacter aceti]GBO79381.1 lysR family transcriptional regulator [Acetobacter aceti NRIC 0242]TCS35512.1 LysR family hydrogen peroxide-inducible transcriptional activator [Acetobacter aceti NBRC 14818]BCI67025.1 LysR family transcriptional regulator [Acetobacter aceti]BCK75101.1 LysR family transcriptional regulator [Acetobacter aceti NBRC 14818]GAN57054.1 transcriptional regulator LysR/OxyR [Acetobacter aceti NBRC 14818]
MMILPSPQQLRYLLALAELRHFGRAASACAVTQSTLSAGILALERQLDASLLDREVGKRVVFTLLGEEVVRRARVALELLEGIAQIAQASREPMTGPVRLGVIPTIGPFILPRLIPLVREWFPQIRLIITEDMTERLLEKIAVGRLDAMLLAMPCLCEGLETIPLWRDPFVLALPQHHELAKLSSVPLEMLGNERMVLLEDGHCLRDQTVDVCRQERNWAGNEPESAHTASALHTLVRMIGEDLGVGLLPELAVASGILEGTGVVARPVTGGPAWRTIGLGWRQKSPRTEDFRVLARTLKKLAPSGTDAVFLEEER